jgi:O-antigen/teichoic acid export membrane protein
MTTARVMRHRAVVNSVWLFASRLIGQGLSALTLIVLARSLGAEGLGRYAYITSVIFVANTLTTFGTDTLIIREVAHDPAGAVRWPAAAMLIQGVLAIAVIALIWLISDQQPAMVVYSLALIPLAVSAVYSAVLRGRERMDLYMVFAVASAALQALGVVSVLNVDSSLVTLMLALVGAHTLAAMFVVTAANRLLPDFHITWHIDRVLVRQMLIAGLPLMLLIGLSLVYQRIGVLILTWISGDAMTGQFSAAARLVEALKMLPAAMLGAMFPVLSRETQRKNSNHRDREARKAGAKNGLFWRLFASSVSQQTFGLLSFALVAAIMLTLLADPIITSLFGDDFAPAVPILRLLGWLLIPYVIGAVLSLQLVAAKREREVLVAVVITLPIAIMLHTILITAHGLIGAGEATIISETLQVAILLILARSH